MVKKRLVAVLILRDGKVVQSVRFKHTNAIHYDAVHAMECFNRWAVDEIVLLNVSPSEDSREAFPGIVEQVSRKCFVPLSVGGWIGHEDYARDLLNSGADKLVLNTAFHTDHALVRTLSRRYGKQCIVASMDVRHAPEGGAEAMVDRARRGTGMDAVAWARHAQDLGAGEIFFNSVDHDGARKGYAIETLRQVCSAVEIPVIAFGGVFTWDHLVEGIHAGADAVAAANLFHYTEQSTKKAKRHLAAAGIHVRSEGQSV